MALPRSVKQIRESNGGLADLTDFEIAQHEFGGFSRYYDTFDNFAKDIGFETGGKWGNRAGASVDSYQAGMYGLAEATTGSEWAKRGRERNDMDSANARQLAQSQGAISSFKDIGGVRDFGDYVGGLAIDSAPYLAEAFVGGLAGRAALTGLKVGGKAISRGVASGAGVVGASYPSAVGSILQAQREQAGTTNLGSAAALGVPYAAANLLGLEGSIGRAVLPRNSFSGLDLLQGAKGVAARTAATGLRTGLSEGTNETLQEGFTQMGRMDVDPSETFLNPRSKDRFAEAAVGGALLGQSAGMGMGGWRRSEQYQAENDPALDQYQTNGLTTSQGFEDLLRPPQDRVDPLGDLTPDWTTSQGFEDIQTPRTRPPEIVGPLLPGTGQRSVFRQDEGSGFDATGLNPAAGEPSLVPMQGQGPARSALLITPDMPGVDMNPETMPVDFMGTVAGSDLPTNRNQTPSQVDQMNDPGAVIARQNWMAQQERQQAIQKQADTTRQEIEQRTKRAEQLGLKGDAAAKLLVELDAALQDGTLNDTTYGTALGMLQARKLGEAKGVLKQARADVAAKAGQAEIKQAGVDADKKQAAADLARLQGKPATPAGAELALVEKTSPATAPALPKGTTTVGRKGRENKVDATQLLSLIAKAPELDKQRILAVLGLEQDVDPTTGKPIMLAVSEPRSHDKVAEMEAVRTGKQVTRQAIKQSLQKYGIDDGVINAMSGVAPDTVSTEALGMDPAEDGSGFRVEGSLSKATGQGLVDDGTRQTKQQKALSESADTLLATAPAEVEVDPNVVPPGGVDLRDQNPAIIEANQRALLAHVEASNAEADWDSPKVEWQALPDTLKADWVEAYVWNMKRNEGELNLQELADEQVTIEDRYKQWSDNQGVQAPTGAGPVGLPGARSGATVVARTKAEKPQLRDGPSDAPVKDPGQVAWDKLRETQPRMPPWGTMSARQQSQARDLAQRDMLNLAAANTVASRINDDVRSVDLPINRDVLESRGKGAATGSTVKQVTDEVKKFMRLDRLGTSVFVVETTKDLPEASRKSVSKQTQGIAVFGPASRPTVYLIASQIEPKDIRAVFLHEVGGHIGLEQLLSPAQFKKLTDRLLTWAQGYQDGSASVEQILASTAVERVTLARVKPEERRSEMLAYFLEEAVKAGIDPTATNPKVSSDLRTWFSTVMRAFKSAMQKLGLKPETLTAQNIVDMAYGAANLDMRSEGGIAAGQQASSPRTQQSIANPILNTGSPKLDKLAEEVGYLFKAWKRTPTKVGILSMFTEDLVTLAEKTLPSARQYKDLMDTVQVERGRMERDVIQILQDFRALGKVEQGVGPASVNTYLRDSTMSKTWGYQPAWAPEAQVDPAMKARFDVLSPEAQKVVQKVFTHGNDSLQQIRAAANENIGAEFDAVIAELTAKGDLDGARAEEKAKTTALKDFNTLIDQRGDWPYAPLKRFGKHVVMGVSAEYQAAKAAGDNKRMQALQRDGDHYYVGFAETKRAALKMQDEISASYDVTDSFEKLEGADAFMGGRDVLGAFQRLRKFSRDMKDTKDGKVDERVDTMMRQLYLTLLSETSARKGELHRKGVAGADRDMMRAFATQGRASAHFVASLKTNGKITDHLRDMKTAVSSSLGNRETKQAYYNEIMRRHSMSLEYVPQGVIDKVMAGTSIYMLLTNPSYYLINATQPGMMSVPLMAGKHGYANAWQQMIRSAREVAPLLKNGSFTEENYANLPTDVRQAIEELADKGVIDISLESVLGNFESESDSPTRYLDIAVQKMRGVAQTVESLNRLTTAMAAYRMEKAKTGSHEAAVKYAGEVIYETHGDYSGFNAPRLMRAGVGRLATQFRKFQLIQLSMFARLMNRAFYGASKEEKAVARKALILNLTHLLAMGGVMGLPGFTFIAWFVGKALDDDEPDDPEATLRRLIGDKDVADLLLKGAPKLAGVDVSGRIGAGGMLSILPYTDIKIDRDGYGDIATGIMGPFIGGLLPRVADGVSLIAKGDLWRGSEMLLPAGLANLSKAARFPTEGVTTRNGDVVMSSDDIGMLEILSQSVGLPSKKLTDRQVLSASQFKADTFYRNRTTQLKNEYTRAFKANDAQAMRELRQDWLDTQAARKKVGFSTQPLSTLLKAPQEQRKRESGSVAGVKVTDTNRRFVEQLAN